jgi:hypothetical protein
MTGVGSCYKNQLVLNSGYWRRYADNEAVLSCPLQDACVGGNMTGEALCAAGYSGQLCAVCDNGYYLDDAKCVKCASGGFFSPVLVVLLTFLSLLSLILVVVAVVYFVYLRSPPNEQSSTLSEADSEDIEEAETNNNKKKEADNQTSTKLAIATTTIIFGYEMQSNNQRLVDFLVQVESKYYAFRAQYKKFITQVKVIMSTYQVTIAASSVLSVSMPHLFSGFTNAFSFLNLNFSSLLPLGCAAQYSFIDKLVVATLTPMAFLLLLFPLQYAVERYRIQRNKDRQRGDKRRAFDRLKDNYMSYWFYISYLVLPAVSTMIFQIFLCTNVDPNDENSGQDDYYLTADMSISCSSSYYYSGVGYAVVMILIYPIGIPASYCLLLYYNREEIRDRHVNRAVIPPPEVMRMSAAQLSASRYSSSDRPSSLKSARDTTITIANPMLLTSSVVSKKVTDSVSTEKPSTKEAEDENPEPSNEEPRYLSIQTTRIAFLWQAYKPQYWYWESVESTRRLMLTAVLSVCGPGTFDQAVLSVLLALLYIKVYGYFNPYDNPNNNVLAEVGQFQIFFTFFGGLIVQANLLSRHFSTLLDVFLLLVNFAVVMTTIYYLPGNQFNSMVEGVKFCAVKLWELCAFFIGTLHRMLLSRPASEAAAASVQKKPNQEEITSSAVEQTVIEMSDLSASSNPTSKVH